MFYRATFSAVVVALGFVFIAGFKGSGTAAVAGTYDLKLSDEAVSLCEWLQASVPAGRLVLSEEGEYRLERYVEGRRLISEGDFELEDDEVILNRGNSRKTLRGMVARNRVTIEGLAFERQGFEDAFGREDVRREVPARRDLPREDTRPREVRREVPRASEAPARRDFNVVGRWIVQSSNGRVDNSIRFDFSQDGWFTFTGMGGSSKGTYLVEDDRIILRYQEVDGQRVEFPYNGRAYITADGFRIDNFRYIKD